MSRPSHSTDDELLVLHALRCGGFADPARVADTSGLNEPLVEAMLASLAAEGLVSHLEGPFGGWGLTEAGRAVDAERVAADLDGSGAREVALETYDAFLVLNPQLLDLCTAWQMRTVGGVTRMNDHRDRAYDSRVLDRIADLHGRTEMVLAPLGEAVPRFARYPVRLSAALASARAGELGYVVESTSSYHTVWFQLHEDLLVTLGIPRH